MRYTYATYKTRERANDALDEEMARGAISEGERPKVEPVKDHRQRVTAILRKLAKDIEGWPGANDFRIGLRDLNGNKVGDCIAS